MRKEEEVKRTEEERMKREEEKRKEEERLRKEEEEKRKEEERMKKEEEKKRKEEERLRKEEEEKRKEEERMKKEEEEKRKEEERMRKEEEEKGKEEKRIKEEEEIRKQKNQMKKVLVELKIVIQRKREDLDLFVPRDLFLFSIDIMKEIPKKDSTTKAPASPRIPKELSEPDNGPVEQTEKHVSVEGPGAETGRQERPQRGNWSQRIVRFFRRCF
uniref:Vicilin-like seed storage protein At2g18540 n=1 Tax=Crassostrea virginica TaxID=6565 RepID=A0A8B8E8U8_CRAVI|nr:vicilin-like seed storage protein At2g18540 [Crassostrea virginica]